jgi:hypothetical protein
MANKWYGPAKSQKFARWAQCSFCNAAEYDHKTEHTGICRACKRDWVPSPATAASRRAAGQNGAKTAAAAGVSAAVPKCPVPGSDLAGPRRALFESCKGLSDEDLAKQLTANEGNPVHAALLAHMAARKQKADGAPRELPLEELNEKEALARLATLRSKAGSAAKGRQAAESKQVEATKLLQAADAAAAAAQTKCIDLEAQVAIVAARTTQLAADRAAAEAATAEAAAKAAANAVGGQPAGGGNAAGATDVFHDASEVPKRGSGGDEQPADKRRRPGPHAEGCRAHLAEIDACLHRAHQHLEVHKNGGDEYKTEAAADQRAKLDAYVANHTANRIKVVKELEACLAFEAAQADQIMDLPDLDDADLGLL